MKRTLLRELLDARARGRPVALATALETGVQRLVFHDEERAEVAGRDIAGDVRAALAADRPCVIEGETGAIFINVYNPPLKLVLVGAVHISQALAPMARAVGYAVTVVDPRGAFATAERFPDVRLVEEWPDELLAAEPPDARTAVVTLTHDPKLDDAALLAAFASPAFYIGALGSRKTHAARLDRLRGQGVGEDAIARIHAPVGLKLGGRSPAEIAISIMAEMTQVLRQPHAARASTSAR